MLRAGFVLFFSFDVNIGIGLFVIILFVSFVSGVLWVVGLLGWYYRYSFFLFVDWVGPGWALHIACLFFIGS
jgi:hypothetical protein